MMVGRRRFIGGALASLSLAWAGRASAAPASSSPRFLVVQANGGWDPLAFGAPMFGRGSIDMELGSGAYSAGNLDLVDGPGRPAVRTFFERHYRRTLMLHGVAARSVNHETCAAVVLTGGTSDERPDFTTLLAHGQRDQYDLPHIAVSGLVFPGPYGVLVSRAEGALSFLVRGELMQFTEPPVSPLPASVGRRVGDLLDRRVAAVAAAHPGSVHAEDLAEGWSRTRRLLANAADFQLEGSATLGGRADTAIEALASGLCRCATIDTGFVFDTHVDNNDQAPQLQALFTELNRIVGLLDSTVGPQGQPLAADTVLVVLSEMSRTPIYNGTGGRDHWPFTTMLMMGPGIQGDRTAGAYTDGYIGIGVDPASGDLDPSRAGIATDDLAATLLAVGGMDPGLHLPNATPLTGLLS